MGVLGVPILERRMGMGAGFRLTGTGPFGALIVLMLVDAFNVTFDVPSAGRADWAGFSTSIWLGEHMRQVQLL